MKFSCILMQNGTENGSPGGYKNAINRSLKIMRVYYLFKINILEKISNNPCHLNPSHERQPSTR